MKKLLRVTGALLGLVLMMYSGGPVQARDNKVWICHFSGHFSDGSGQIEYVGPDVVIGQGPSDPDQEVGCSVRGGHSLNVARQGCSNGHQAIQLNWGSCEG